MVAAFKARWGVAIVLAAMSAVVAVAAPCRSRQPRLH